MAVARISVTAVCSFKDMRAIVGFDRQTIAGAPASVAATYFASA